MAMHEQPQLTGLEFRKPVDVTYFRVEKNPEQSFLERMLGRRATRLIQDDDDPLSFVGHISSDDITPENIADPDLRYALRYAAAGAAQGWIEVRPGHMISNRVDVTVIDDGDEKQLVGAAYPGIGDDFIEKLKRADPRQA